MEHHQINDQLTMKTKKELKNKKMELEQWLVDNPNHMNRLEIQNDLKKVLNQLIDKNK